MLPTGMKNKAGQPVLRIGMLKGRFSLCVLQIFLSFNVLSCFEQIFVFDTDPLMG